MLFICLDVKPMGFDVTDLMIKEKIKYNIFSFFGNSLNRLIKTKDNESGEYYLYAKPHYRKYCETRNLDPTLKTIATLAADYNISILTNFSTTVLAKTFSFQIAGIPEIKTEMWLTILTDQDIRFYKPEVLSTSLYIDINLLNVIEEHSPEDSLPTIDGESSGNYFLSLTANDNILPASIDNELKNMIRNTFNALNDIIIVTSKTQYKPMDYTNYKGRNYLFFACKYNNGIYTYCGVREYKDNITFTGADITVQKCNYIAYAEMYDQGSAHSIIVTTANTWYGFIGGTAGVLKLISFSSSIVADKLTILEGGGGVYYISISIAFHSATAAIIQFKLYINNAGLARTWTYVTPTANEYTSVSTSTIIELNTNDYIDIRATSSVNATTIVIDQLNFSIMRIG